MLSETVIKTVTDGCVEDGSVKTDEADLAFAILLPVNSYSTDAGNRKYRIESTIIYPARSRFLQNKLYLCMTEKKQNLYGKENY